MKPEQGEKVWKNAEMHKKDRKHKFDSLSKQSWTKDKKVNGNSVCGLLFLPATRPKR